MFATGTYETRDGQVFKFPGHVPTMRLNSGDTDDNSGDLPVFEMPAALPHHGNYTSMILQ